MVLETRQYEAGSIRSGNASNTVSSRAQGMRRSGGKTLTDREVRRTRLVPKGEGAAPRAP